MSDDRARKTSPARRRLMAALVAVPLLLQVWGCTGHRYTRPSAGEIQRGMASWYGSQFHGRKTANGEVYDMYGVSAAHRELPLGTVIDVRNLDTGKEVRVRVNDRGPFKRGRILDLSYGAAKKLGMVEAGLARIELRVVSVGRGRSGPTRFTRWAVQLGAFREYANAEALCSKLRGTYPEIEIRSADGWHRVQIGEFTDKADATSLLDQLRGSGFTASVVAR